MAKTWWVLSSTLTGEDGQRRFRSLRRQRLPFLQWRQFLTHQRFLLKQQLRSALELAAVLAQDARRLLGSAGGQLPRRAIDLARRILAELALREMGKRVFAEEFWRDIS